MRKTIYALYLVLFEIPIACTYSGAGITRVDHVSLRLQL